MCGKWISPDAPSAIFQVPTPVPKIASPAFDDGDYDVFEDYYQHKYIEYSVDDRNDDDDDNCSWRSYINFGYGSIYNYHGCCDYFANFGNDINYVNVNHRPQFDTIIYRDDLNRFIHEHCLDDHDDEFDEYFGDLDFERDMVVIMQLMIPKDDIFREYISYRA
ncbi:hypothetical protein TSTA_043600 [Talaromyces stipitatus ATCC 10500]|uniref:Uncharacterized protein n=1 Tax=Talaromyces stipitatus (strain ATCC 10500 / CBS 375.48 / QM 6759 / NRRL 1006) TaxID=441959 RepID=B8MKP0_TALSN|nr:uncharacterized protein TSTA_043600 [Talaromyces stipitatus ATCC 10500]EED14889.1 hypothetical protein TSTA_043600 [Talaromyces stipitatus ATCC 10500]